MHKKNILGAIVLSSLMAMGFASGLNAEYFTVAKADTDITVTLDIASPYHTNNGVYLQLKGAEGLPFDTSWEWRIKNADANAVLFDGEASKANIPFVLVTVGQSYLAIGDVGLGREVGTPSLMTVQGTWSGTKDDVTYNVTINPVTFQWTGSAWINYFGEDDLEYADRISLAQFGLDDVINAPIDTEGYGQLTSSNTYAEDSRNTSRSFILNFDYKYEGVNIGVAAADRVGDTSPGFSIRLGATTWVTGHYFEFSLLSRWGDLGVATFHEMNEGNIINNSGDCLIHLLDGEKHNYECGVIKVKNTANDYFRFVKEDGNYLLGKTMTLASDVVRTNRVAIYYPLDDIELTGTIAQKVGEDAFMFNAQSSTANGLYFYHVDDMPFYPDWVGPRGTPALKANFKLNGQPLVRPSTGRANDVIVKYDKNKYYFAINDCGKTAVAGDVVTIEGEFHFYEKEAGKTYSFALKHGEYRFNGTSWEEIKFESSLVDATIDDVPENDPLRNIGTWKPDHSGHAVKNFDQTPETLVYKTEQSTGKTGLYFTSTANKKAEVRFYLPDDAYKAETKGYAFHSVSFDYRVMKTSESVGTEAGDGLTADGELTSTPSSTTTSFMIQLMNRGSKKYFCQDAPLINDGLLHTFTLNVNYADIVGFNFCLFNFVGSLFISNIQFDYLPYDEALNNFVVDSLKMFTVLDHTSNWEENLPAALEAYEALSADEKNIFETDPAYKSARNRFNTWKGLKAAADLAAYKVEKKGYIDATVAALIGNYRQAEQNQINAGATSAKEAIDAAESIAAVDAILDNLAAQLASLKTAAQYEAEEALAAAKVTAKGELDAIDLTVYRDAEKATVQGLISAGKETIDAQESIENVNAQLANIKETIAAVKTDAQLTAEELAAYKVEKKQLVDDTVAGIINDYREAEQGQVNTIAGNTKTAIDAAENIAAVDNLLGDMFLQLVSVKTAAQYEEEEALAAAKVSAKAELDAIDLTVYRDAEKETVQGLISAGKETIDAQTSINGVEVELANIKEAIAAVKTAAQYEAEEAAAALAAAKLAAKQEIEAYAASKGQSNYSAAGWTEIQGYVQTGKDAIDAANCDTVEKINRVVSSTKDLIDSVKLKSVEELEAAKASASEELRNYYNAKDGSKYSQENLNKMKDELDKGLAAIDAATSVDGVNSALAAAKEAIDAIPVNAPAKSGCGGSIAATSIILSLTALIGAGLLMARKRKED